MLQLRLGWGRAEAKAWEGRECERVGRGKKEAADVFWEEVALQVMRVCCVAGECDAPLAPAALDTLAPAARVRDVLVLAALVLAFVLAHAYLSSLSAPSAFSLSVREPVCSCLALFARALEAPAAFAPPSVRVAFVVDQVRLVRAHEALVPAALAHDRVASAHSRVARAVAHAHA